MQGVWTRPCSLVMATQRKHSVKDTLKDNVSNLVEKDSLCATSGSFKHSVTVLLSCKTQICRKFGEIKVHTEMNKSLFTGCFAILIDYGDLFVSTTVSSLIQTLLPLLSSFQVILLIMNVRYRSASLSPWPQNDFNAKPTQKP